MTKTEASIWDRTFPVLNHRADNFPLSSVPWGFVAPHEAQARRNHDQTLQRLAERGGLSAKEMLAVVSGKHWYGVLEMDRKQANDELLQLLDDWKRAQAQSSTGGTGK
jgi:hypothetical protein